MSAFTTPSFDVVPVLAARGRGISRMLEGLWNGDPTTWIILGVGVVAVVGFAVVKSRLGMDDDDAVTPEAPIREGEAPAEPGKSLDIENKTGSAGASPSLFG